MKQQSNWIRKLSIAFWAVFVASTFMVIVTLARSAREKQVFRELSAMHTADGTGGTGEGTSAAEEYHSPYLPLKEENPDFYGWLSIDDTDIDYPVMFTPEDPEHYLRRDFYGSPSLSGVPFLDASCTREGGNYLIHGHNLNNGDMFADLLSYSKEAYWREHPLIRFDTLEAAGSYEVIGVFYSQVYGRDQSGVFRYYRYTDLSQPEIFEEYVRQVKAASLYETGVEASCGDQLLTLSTCSYHTENGRFVVVAKVAGKP